MRLRLPQCNYCNVSYCDPRHITRYFTYYDCQRVLSRDTSNTYKTAQKHEQQNSGHFSILKTATEPRALTRSRIPIPLISRPQIRMVRGIRHKYYHSPTISQSESQSQLTQSQQQQPGTSTSTSVLINKPTIPCGDPEPEKTQVKNSYGRSWINICSALVR